ncbi:TonB-dependent receptor domain-containing protein [Usitatibacter palustris]|uniref:Vitamin B12 transporter BtuB n=1 Tax=Usitatibacter palustris TaxID=2732487 RepID=A0A6M4H9L9_9PROT|nr:TonB-dependent receptor [Usitatibacter palustris]QJR16449.1 Vitamin B12 transporter BtuB [Usitatibacter palustris]
MKVLPFAGLVGLASLGSQAQVPLTASPPSVDTVVVTATRSMRPDAATLREAIVITRADLENAGTQSLADILLRRAGVEIRGTGGPGQPVGLMMRGAGTAQTLILIDGIRAGSATVGTTSIENIPIELIERIEIVKGPLSSLYGSDAIGGVVQIFTRGKSVPHLFVSAGYGEDSDGRVAAGVTGADQNNSFSLSAGGRKVDAPSATNARSFCHDEDRDPYKNAFAEAKYSRKLWQGETIAVNTFYSRGKTHFDGCPDDLGNRHDDLNDQSIFGAGITSSTEFYPGWTSRLSYGFGQDEIETTGAFTSNFRTRQNQITWINEFVTSPGGVALIGLEGLRQEVSSNSAFTQDHRDIGSIFGGVNETWQNQRLEASLRYDRDDQFGNRTTGSFSYGVPWQGVGLVSTTYGEGFRAPTFFDLYGPASDFYQPNPDLRPERSKSVEFSVRANPGSAWGWKATYFDNQIEDLITYDFATMSSQNVARARIKGVEASVNGTYWGVRIRGNLTVQRPEDEDTGYRLQGRAKQFGTVDLSRDFGDWTTGLSVLGSGDRFDSRNESEASRLPGYAVVDARVRYRFDKRWAVDVIATNLLDKRYETSVGYDAPRRGVFLKVTFDAF